MKKSTELMWAGIAQNKSFAFLFAALLFLAGCNKDDENLNSAEVQKIVGTYTVNDTDEWDEVETYSITVTHKGGANVEISNFGDIMYVPVKATIKGGKVNIPSQTFKGKTMTIIISGSGTFDGVNLNFDYVIDTTDGYLLEHSCQATKSNS